MSDSIKASDVKALRDRTGAGMMDCKAALLESSGDVDAAIEILRIKGQAAAAKRGQRQAAEGVVQSYIHANNKIGVLVEVNCETDFVGRNEAFIEFARDLALHIAAAAPLYISEEDVPQEDKEKELRIFAEQITDKPQEIREKIAQGKLEKWLTGVVLLKQIHVNTYKYENKTIDEIRAEVSAKTGENIVINRFTRFAVGE